MKKIILKTSLITVAALAAAALLIFSLWILISPQTMATASEKTGNYSFAVTCANLKYKYSKDPDDLSRCCQDSILSGKDKLVIKYCEKLLSHEKFDEVCERKDNSLNATLNYKAYICGSLALSQYRQGELDKALSSAEEGGADGFIKLVLEVCERGNIDEAKAVKEKLISIEYVGDTADGLIKILNEFIEN